jgi:hypothetical protein
MRLSEKYRPQSLVDVVGQPVVRMLRALAAKSYSCCVLLECSSGGVGKTSTALAFANDLGCIDEFHGLHIAACSEFTVDVARGLFEGHDGRMARQRVAKLVIEPPGNLEWLVPWQPVTDSGDGLVRELKKELVSGHVLHGLPVAAVGPRIDCDDVLFATSDPAKRLAVVHLTWSGDAEADPKWPTTVVYKDWQDWIARCLVPDHQAYRVESKLD